MNREIDDLIQLCREADGLTNPLMDAQIEAICDRAGVPRAGFCDLFAHRLANEFMAGRLSFDQADAAINSLHHYSLMGQPQQLLDGLAWQVYRAFDAGEYLSPSEPDGTDAIAKYTRPLLAKALASYGAGHEA